MRDGQCHWCTGPLGDSPSSDYCSQDCQRDWQRAQLRIDSPEQIQRAGVRARKRARQQVRSAS
ncbi:hypothetical protein GCM10012275_53330 [Longimycelium tulufanense]|uniref:Uncharacterized protein n=1 Tax=Longimycelium tulufanense TaxID=907463 RepID=A0A8J3FXQ1_9PSEU|nr:hypothetical protein [Longimycelium tulufanense]GGM75907.1 hypothetical protein GCM10012275_53330 [Longimycelium tulufanense]